MGIALMERKDMLKTLRMQRVALIEEIRDRRRSKKEIEKEIARVKEEIVYMRGTNRHW